MIHGVNDPKQPRKITCTIIRPGEQEPEDDNRARATPAERMNAVWELTLLCLQWRPGQNDEPRLQRSISRIQRSQKKFFLIAGDVKIQAAPLSRI